MEKHKVRRQKMFIDCAKLEKILKTDYKTWGVKFGLTKKGM